MAKFQKTALALIFLFTACEKGEKISTFTGMAMTIPYQVKVGEPLNTWKKKRVEQIIAREFSKIDSTCNHWNPKSSLSQYNKGTLKTLPKEVEKLLAISNRIQKLSGGRFDPSKGALIQLWKNHLNVETTPSESELTAAHTANYFDFDGILKGFAVDRIAKKLKKLGYTSLYVEWGGEIRCVGQHPTNRPWKIASGSQLIEITDSSLATSGDSVQRWGNQTHIYNPKTEAMLRCKKTIRSVTVQAKSCALADAIATAAMLYDNPKELKEFIKNVQNQYEETYVYDNLL
ncbi:MAG: FAD:protein FMN transferase [Candidatus Algichlamydia australiensis]|nr:FAD:protein FMN transferase [Chlamydiales bacterium]